jgi:hypothetical protein
MVGTISEAHCAIFGHQGEVHFRMRYGRRAIILAAQCAALIAPYGSFLICGRAKPPGSVPATHQAPNFQFLEFCAMLDQ